MDIHRCRFVDYPPSAINSLAFTHSYDLPGSKNHPLRLAVGRANGNIEIWNPQNGDWIHEITLYGGQGRSVDDLAWVRDVDEKDESTGRTNTGRLRLFSSGYASEITEWDLTTGLPRQRSTGSHSEIWCLAAQPAYDYTPKGTLRDDGVPKPQDLVVGCADGSLAQFSTEDGGLTFKNFIARASSKKARALSITFQRRDRVIAGYSNSVIRVYDLNTPQMVRSIQTGVGLKGAPKDTLVWSLECLSDGTLVSGDSTGEVAFWDGKNYGQLAKFKSHEADVLCLASSNDGRTVFSSGMDRRTCTYHAMPSEFGRRFKLKQHRKLHNHDVKAMSRYDGIKFSMAVSGGVEGSLVVVPLLAQDTEYHRKLPFAPQMPPITGADRFVVSWWENQVGVWSIAPRRHSDQDNNASYKEVLRMSLSSEEHITSASVSKSGRQLAVSTMSNTKLFLLANSPADDRHLKATKIDTPPTLSQNGSRLTRISPDARWLLTLSSTDDVKIHRLVANAESNTVSVIDHINLLSRRSRPENKLDWLDGAWGRYKRSITRAVFSEDSRSIAVSDISGTIDTWTLQGEEDLSAEACEKVARLNGEKEDSDEEDGDEDDERLLTFYGEHWVQSGQPPRLQSMPLVLCFRSKASAPHLSNGFHPSTQGPAETLLVLTSKHELLEFVVRDGSLSDWSRRNPSRLLPDEFKIQKDRATGAIVEPLRNRLWLYSATWLCMFNLDEDLPARAGLNKEPAGDQALANDEHDEKPERKRKRNSSFSAGRPDMKKVMNSRSSTQGAAGDKIRDSELGGGVAERGYRTLDKRGASKLVETTSAKRQTGSDDEDGSFDEDEDEDEQKTKAPIFQRRPIHKPESSRNEFYLTQRYRSILGIVPLSAPSTPMVNGSGRRSKEKAQQSLEVALIERPNHEIDMGPRHPDKYTWDD